MANHEVYENPLISRYSNMEMSHLWSAQKKHSTWRQLWVALAETEMELNLTTADGTTPRIKPEQVEELRQHIDDIDFKRAAEHEKRVRHDVMAHVHTYGEVCPSAQDIIHLGATSCFVTDNADLLILRDALKLIQKKLVNVIDALANFAEQWKGLPTLGSTHYQPAQLTTVGKRACLWCQDFLLDLTEIEHRLSTLKFRGAKGTTGTQASFLSLFHNDHDKVKQLDQRIAEKMGFDNVFPVTGQTYPRKVDAQILDALSGIGQSTHKLGTDLRLLSHDRELEEAQEKEQIGSSAMAYKQNPMRAERMCALARFLISLPANASQTAAVQWLERTLDDSANRRLSLPQAFLAADAVLTVALNVSRRLRVHEAVIDQNVQRVLPFMATENIMMEAVALGGDRQQLHEAIRQHSHAETAELKAGKDRNELINRLQEDGLFTKVNLGNALDAKNYIGRAKEQVEEFIQSEVEPIRQRYQDSLGEQAELHV